MQMDPRKLYTIAPVAPSDSIPIKPEFIRLPKDGKVCPYTGLSRGKLYQLILPSPENHHNPPVRSVCLRPRGAVNGVRLIHLDSLLGYLYGLMEAQGNA